MALLAAVFLAGTIAVSLLWEIPDSAPETGESATPTTEVAPGASNPVWVHVIALSGAVVLGLLATIRRHRRRVWPFKPRVKIERLIGEFYDSHVAGAAVHERRWGRETVDSLFKSIEMVADDATDLDANWFREELVALQAELFGLAWVHRVKKEANILREAFLTRGYLEKAELPELWEAMAVYNAGVAVAVEDSVKEGWVGLVEKWVGGGIDQDAARRVSNRLGTGRGAGKRGKRHVAW